MKRFTSFILLIFIFSFTLLSCSSSGDGEATTPADTQRDTLDGSLTSADTTTEEVTTEDPSLITLKIGSYNIANGREVSHAMKLLANDILAKDLDIVGLQEVDKFAKRSKYQDTMKVLSEYTGYKYYYYTKAINIAGDASKYGQDGEYGTGILSKYPIIEAESYALESGGNEQRMLGYAKIDVNGQIINFYNTHLSFESFEIRSGQFETLAEKLKDKELCILTGDFNIAGFVEYKALPFLGTTCNANNWLTTFPSNGGSIDNVLFSSEFTLSESGVLDRGHSDHNMLYAVLKFKAK